MWLNSFLFLSLLFFQQPASYLLQFEEEVKIEQSSIKQQIDYRSGYFLIDGSIDNEHAYRIQNVAIRLYAPGPSQTDAKVWELDPGLIEAKSQKNFQFVIKPTDLAQYKTFVIRVWAYTPVITDPVALLQTTNAVEPAQLRGITSQMIELVKAHPEQFDQLYDKTNGVGRLCLTEAVLRNETILGWQRLAERLVRGDKVVDYASLEKVLLFSASLKEFSPFELIGHWFNVSKGEFNLIELLKTFPHKALPLAIRLYYTGSSDAQQFASNYLHSVGFDSVEQQSSVADPLVKADLINLYQDLYNLFPEKDQFRHALGILEYKNNNLFVLIVIILAVLMPSGLSFLYWKKRYEKENKLNSWLTRFE